jgi:hypothetical protein
MTEAALTPMTDSGRAPDAPAGVRARLEAAAGALPVLAQLILMALVVRGFALESPAFARVFSLVVVGYALQIVVPARMRLALFAALSAGGAVIVFGAAQAAWLWAVGLGLIGLAHLPIPFGWRVASILTAGAALAMFRAAIWTPPWSPIIWPIFGAMFMFRLIVYLYDLRNRAAPFGFWRALAYFFMLPTVCFPLFPVVDYKTMWRGWAQSKDALPVHQRGAEWILRGLVQLLLYRLIYHSFSVDAASVQTASQALVYLVRPYLLYLRISGSFHLVIGIMHLYGFALPATSHNWVLASNFTDYWRRINIYWKDFLQKIFFNPVYFRLSRRMGATASLATATLIAFFATWALHSYQWFWIRKAFPVAWQDIVFWSVMGIAVLANMLVEARRGRRRRLTRPERSARAELGLALRTVATFSVIVLCWAVWSTRSLAELGHVISRLRVVGAADVAWIAAGVVGLGLAAVLYERSEQRAVQRAGAPGAELRVGVLRLPWAALRVGTAAMGLLALVYASLVFYYPPAVADVVDRLKNPLRLNRGDAAMMDRGYYEELTDVSRFNPELAQVYSQKPADWDRCWAFHHIDSFPSFEMLPSRRVAYMGAVMTTNRWAMRDRDYTREKPSGVYRIALLGDSQAMGGGTDDRLTFENVAEDRLNAMPGTPHRRYEILNFSVAGYGPAARRWLLHRSVWPFHPDVVMVTGVSDLVWMAREVVGGAQGRYAQPFPAMEESARAAGIDARTPYEVAMAKIQPYRERVLRDIYEGIVRECRDHGARPVALFIPQPRREAPESMVEIRRQIEIAREAGFHTIDLLDTYDATADLAPLWVAPWDRHPNVRGHAMLGERLYQEIRNDPSF